MGGIGAAWATARATGGPRAAFFAATAIAVCGIWYGAMFAHTKDVPFAAAMMGALYFLLRLARELPTPRWHLVLLFGALSGCALGIRVLGLFLVSYSGFIVLAHAPFVGITGWRRTLTFVARNVEALACALDRLCHYGSHVAMSRRSGSHPSFLLPVGTASCCSPLRIKWSTCGSGSAGRRRSHGSGRMPWRFISSTTYLISRRLLPALSAEILPASWIASDARNWRFRRPPAWSGLRCHACRIYVPQQNPAASLMETLAAAAICNRSA